MVHTKVPVVLRDDYVMYLELYDGLLWFHTDINRWSSKIKTKYLEDLNLLQYLVKIPLAALVEEDNKKLAKFGEVTGWIKVNEIMTKENKVAYIYSRSV